MLSTTNQAVNNTISDTSREFNSNSDNLQPSQHGSPSIDQVDLSIYQTPPLSIENLPQELFVEVFKWLDIRSLDAASLVSTKWHERIESDALWRAVFLQTYGTQTFSRVTASLSWKTEVIERHNDLRMWKRTAGANHISSRLHIPAISHVSIDFPSMRMLAFSLLSDSGLITDPSKGTVAAPYFCTNGLTPRHDITTCVATSKFGIVHGFETGHVSGTFLQKAATVRHFVTFSGHHQGRVTAIWISKTISPRASINSNNAITVVSGGSDGQIFIWDAFKGDPISSFFVGTTENPEIITFLETDNQNRIIIGTATGLVYSWARKKGDVSGDLTLIGQPKALLTVYRYACDIEGGYVLVTDGNSIIRHTITDDSNKRSSVMLEMPTGLEEYDSEVVLMSLDKSPFAYVNENSLPKLVPGEVGRYLIATSGGSYAYIWNMRASVSENDVVPLIHAINSPFVDTPTISAVSINPAIFALCSPLGVVYIFNVLTGKRIQLGTVRFPRRILDYSEIGEGIQESTRIADDFIPFHLELDPDPKNPQGILVVQSSVQYFEFGVNKSLSNVKSRGIKKKTPGKRRHSSNGTPRNEVLLREIDDDVSALKELHQEIAQERRQRAPFVGEGLTEEEQLSYAMMLSQESESRPENVDKDLAEAIRLSLEQGGTSTGASSFASSATSNNSVVLNSAPIDVTEKDWERAIQLSLEQTNANPAFNTVELENNGGSSSSRSAGSNSVDKNDESWQVMQAIKESMNNQSEASNNSEQEDLELAIKLSMMDTGRW